jgi:uncharacterized protein
LASHIFNHLPIDITYVDEHDEVRFFSAPVERILPRTKASIGRDVHNCHPPESNEYKGVIEVTEEISHIKKMEGEKRLLDW